MSTDQRLTNLRRTLSRARAGATLLAQERDCRAFDVLIGMPEKRRQPALDAAVHRTTREVTQLEAKVRAAEQHVDTHGLGREPRD